VILTQCLPFSYRIEIESQMNPFEVHGIPHLSPSSLNTFAASPAMFILDKLMKRRGKVGAAAHRGTAVEFGVAHGLETGAKDEECIEKAINEFWRLSAMSPDPRNEKEREAIPDMVKLALDNLRPYGPPTSMQGRVELRVCGLQVPIIGFYDFEWSNHKIIVDLKTTHALPSQIKLPHARQVALYSAFRNHDYDPRLAYVTSKKAAVYRLESAEEHMRSLERIALSVQKLLSVSNDAREIAGLVAPDVESFYFNSPEMRKAAYEVWGV